MTVEKFVVYGKYKFLAEEADELNFNQGEPIIVLEKDDVYGDGWWMGENALGQRGLFPHNFTTYENILNIDTSKISAKLAAEPVNTLSPINIPTQLSPSISSSKSSLPPPISVIANDDLSSGIHLHPSESCSVISDPPEYSSEDELVVKDDEVVEQAVEHALLLSEFVPDKPTNTDHTKRDSDPASSLPLENSESSVDKECIKQQQVQSRETSIETTEPIEIAELSIETKEPEIEPKQNRCSSLQTTPTNTSSVIYKSRNYSSASSDVTETEHEDNEKEEEIPKPQFDPNYRSRHPHTWINIEVIDWLVQSGFVNLVDSFSDIHGSSLLTLSLSDLRSLGIDSLTDRINLLHKILVLKDGYRRLSVEIEVNPKRNGTVMEQEVFERVESLQERLVEGDDELGYRDEEIEIDETLSKTCTIDRPNKSLSRFSVSDYLLYDSPGRGSILSGVVNKENKADTCLENSFSFSDDEETKVEEEELKEKEQVPERVLSPNSFEKEKKKSSNLISNLTRKLTRTRSSKKPAPLSINTSRSASPSSHLSPSSCLSPSPTPTPDESLSNPDFSGHLHIRLPPSKTYKRRYCILKSGVLFILKSPDSSKMIAMIPLTNETFKILPGNEKNTFKAVKIACGSPKNALSPRNKGEGEDGTTVYFACESQLVMVGWINVLVKAGKNVVRTGPMPLIPIIRPEKQISESKISNNYLSAETITGRNKASSSPALPALPVSPSFIPVTVDQRQKSPEPTFSPNRTYSPDHLYSPNRILTVKSKPNKSFPAVPKSKVTVSSSTTNSWQEDKGRESRDSLMMPSAKYFPVRRSMESDRSSTVRGSYR